MPAQIKGRLLQTFVEEESFTGLLMMEPSKFYKALRKAVPKGYAKAAVRAPSEAEVRSS